MPNSYLSPVYHICSHICRVYYTCSPCAVSIVRASLLVLVLFGLVCNVDWEHMCAYQVLVIVWNSSDVCFMYLLRIVALLKLSAGRNID